MQKNINTIFFKPNKNFKSISKTRFIDISSNYKLFGSYVIIEITDFKFNKEFVSKIKKIISKSDLLIISDYGHGFLNGELLNIINSSNIFKSLNAQINSSSKGFTNITKYSKINSLIINETELRQHLKDQTNNINFSKKNNEGKKI